METALCLKQELENLLVEVPNKKTGICNNVYELIKKKYGVDIALTSIEILKKIFSQLGYNKDFPVEFNVLNDINAAKTEYYEGGPKWNSKKSIYCQRRLELLNQIISAL